MISTGKILKWEYLHKNLAKEPRCCNCSAILELTSTIRLSPFSNSGMSVDIRQALFFIITGCNKSANVEFDDEEKVYLCANCLTPFINLYISKQAFLKRSSQKSFISKMTSPIVESILPDEKTNNEETLIQSLAIRNEYNLNAIHFLELFASIKINRLHDNQETKIKTKVSTQERFDITSEVLSSCKICHRKFLHPDLMHKHYNSAHQVIRSKYSCIFCPKKFALKWFLQHHVKTFHGGIEIRHPCNISNKKFSNADNLQTHKIKDHDIRKYGLKCNQCTESFEHISDLREHLIASHIGTWESDAAANNIKEITKRKQKKCMVCKKVFLHSATYYRHVKSSHRFPCLACKIEFASLADLLEHQKGHTETLRCEECDKSFDTELKFNKHKYIVHELQRSFICEICGQSYTRSQLSNHYTWHSETANQFKRYPCNMCNGSYKTKSLWLSHVNKTHGINRKTFKCFDCNETFPQKIVLTKHLEEVHRKEFSYPCKICGRKFVDPNSLRVHFGIHTKAEGFVQQERISKLNEVNGAVNANRVDIMSCFSVDVKEFVCPICARTAGWKTHFVRHLKIHSLIGFTTPGSDKVIPATLKCPQCTQFFPRKDLLLRHIRKKHIRQSPQYININPCNICRKEFKTKVELDKHVNRHFIKIKTTEGERDLNFYYSENSRLFNCPVCTGEFSTKAKKEFISHFSHFHKCKIINDLDMQKKINTELKRYFKCSLCDKRFWDRTLTKQHERVTHHQNKIEQKIQCPICYKLMKKDSLRFHKNCSGRQKSEESISNQSL